ncbi:TRIO and F-actin-binding protein-like [Drosophila pseudoobscura]|uniref:TRIO and F-actin-binding protein-like n=1 Tax=Drosophila pseudoobscura pseudoobscura TaxID=46245 RepID=A0A6I8VZV6_DROPS|nr:TRIO and F-actin-binding protein-like [Drosophila pseudoobscura]
MDNKINCEHNLSNHGSSEGNSCSAVPEDNPFLMVAAVSCSICGGCQCPTNAAKKTDGEQGKAPPKTPPRKGKDLDSKVTYKTGSAGTAGAAGAVGASGGAGASGGSGGAGAGPTSKNSRKISPAKSRESSKSKKIIGPRDESTASKSARPKKIKDQNEMNNQDKPRKIKRSNSNHRPNKNSQDENDKGCLCKIEDFREGQRNQCIQADTSDRNNRSKFRDQMKIKGSDSNYIPNESSQDENYMGCICEIEEARETQRTQRIQPKISEKNSRNKSRETISSGMKIKESVSNHRPNENFRDQRQRNPSIQPVISKGNIRAKSKDPIARQTKAKGSALNHRPKKSSQDQNDKGCLCKMEDAGERQRNPSIQPVISKGKIRAKSKDPIARQTKAKGSALNHRPNKSSQDQNDKGCLCKMEEARDRQGTQSVQRDTAERNNGDKFREPISSEMNYIRKVKGSDSNRPNGNAQNRNDRRCPCPVEKSRVRRSSQSMQPGISERNNRDKFREPIPSEMNYIRKNNASDWDLNPIENSQDDNDMQSEYEMEEARERQKPQNMLPDVSHFIMYCTRIRESPSHSTRGEVESRAGNEFSRRNSQQNEWHKSMGLRDSYSPVPSRRDNECRCQGQQISANSKPSKPASRGVPEKCPMWESCTLPTSAQRKCHRCLPALNSGNLTPDGPAHLRRDRRICPIESTAEGKRSDYSYASGKGKKYEMESNYAIERERKRHRASNSRRHSETQNSRRASETYKAERSRSSNSSPNRHKNKTRNRRGSHKNFSKYNSDSESNGHREKYGRSSSNNNSDCRDVKCKRKCRRCADASTMTVSRMSSREGSQSLIRSKTNAATSICGICPAGKICDPNCSLATQTSRPLMDFQNPNLKGTQTKRGKGVRSPKRKPGTQYTCSFPAQITAIKRISSSGALQPPQKGSTGAVQTPQSYSSEDVRTPQKLHASEAVQGLSKSRDKRAARSGEESDVGVIIDNLKDAVIVCACDSSNLDRTLRELIPNAAGSPINKKCSKKKRPRYDRFASPPFVLNPTPRCPPSPYVNTCCYPVDKKCYTSGCGGTYYGGCCW